MTDLDQLLRETFEHRAALSTGGIAPSAVTRALRRQRRLAVTGAVGVVLLAAVTVTAIAPGHSRVSAGRSGEAPSAPPSALPSALPSNPPTTTLGSLPVTSTRNVTAVSVVVNAKTSYEICEANSCVGVDLNASRIDPVIVSTADTQEGIYGIAPSGAATVLVSVGTGPARAAQLVTLPVPGHPSLFAVRDVTIPLEHGAAPHQDEHFRALASDGRLLSQTDVPGTTSLVERHPVTSALITLPGGKGNAGQVVWGSADHWVCTGGRDATEGATTYRADFCTQATSLDQLVSIGSTIYVSDPQAPTPSSWYLFWAPANTAVTLAPAMGHTAHVIVTPGAGGEIVLVSTNTAQAAQPGVLTAKTPSGQVVYAGPVNAVQSLTTQHEAAGEPIYTVTTGK